MAIVLSAKRLALLPGSDTVETDRRVTIADGALTVGEARAGACDTDLVVASPVNAHDHGYGMRTLAFGCADDALESWIAHLRLRPRTDPYLEALVAFGRLAKTGVAATMHCHNSLNADRLAEEAAAVARAAADVGIRLALSCPLLDRDPWVYGGPERLKAHLNDEDWALLSPHVPRYRPIDAQLMTVEATADALENERVRVQYGPIGPQWCSNELLEAIAEASLSSGRRIHMHLLESPRQRRWLDARFPQGVVAYLDAIGFLSPRLAIAHGVQLRPDEIELLRARGVQLVTNPSANLRLRSGVAPLAEAFGRGLSFAVGLDGTGFDDDQDLWREMRVLRLLHGGREMATALPGPAVFKAAIETGRIVAGFEDATDIALIDYAALTEDLLFDDLDLCEMLLTRMRAPYASGLIVDGRWVMRDGNLLGVDFDAARRELLAQARADLPRLRRERRIAALLGDAIRDHYQAME